MPIDSDTLDRWTNYETAAINSAQQTKDKIIDALKDSDILDDIDFNPYLQGSYANYTIVRESSDVDIVVELEELTYFNFNDLDPEDQEDVDVDDMEYDYWDFRSDVIDVLHDQYPSATIDPTGNAIEIQAPGLPRDADVLVCADYLYYYNYPSGYYNGIVFWPTDSTRGVVNYPKRHKRYGADKQDATDDRFKETVRMFKNARNAMLDDGYIHEGLTESYFIECLLYNVPPGRYVNDLQERWLKIVSYLQETDYSDWECQNNVTNLFGNSRTKWNTWDAHLFIKALETYWENKSGFNSNAHLLNR